MKQPVPPIEPLPSSWESHPNASLLRDTLTVAVPMWIDAIRELSWSSRLVLARTAAQIVAEQGDVILYRSKQHGKTAVAFNAPAKGIACLAFSPGGVRVFGVLFTAKEPVS